MDKKQRWRCAGNARKKTAYKAHFNPDWVKEWPALIAKSHKGDTDAFCRLYYLFIYLFIKTYLYRVVHNQTILILFYSVALFLAKSKSRDN